MHRLSAVSTRPLFLCPVPSHTQKVPPKQSPKGTSPMAFRYTLLASPGTATVKKNGSSTAAPSKTKLMAQCRLGRLAQAANAARNKKAYAARHCHSAQWTGWNR